MMRVPDVARETVTFYVEGADLPTLREAVVRQLDELDHFGRFILEMNVARSPLTVGQWRADVVATVLDPREPGRPPRRWFRWLIEREDQAREA